MQYMDDSHEYNRLYDSIYLKLRKKNTHKFIVRNVVTS